MAFEFFKFCTHFHRKFKKTFCVSISVLSKSFLFQLNPWQIVFIEQIDIILHINFILIRF